MNCIIPYRFKDDNDLLNSIKKTNGPLSIEGACEIMLAHPDVFMLQPIGKRALDDLLLGFKDGRDGFNCLLDLLLPSMSRSNYDYMDVLLTVGQVIRLMEGYYNNQFAVNLLNECLVIEEPNEAYAEIRSRIVVDLIGLDVVFNQVEKCKAIINSDLILSFCLVAVRILRAPQLWQEVKSTIFTALFSKHGSVRMAAFEICEWRRCLMDLTEFCELNGFRLKQISNSVGLSDIRKYLR